MLYTVPLAALPQVSDALKALGSEADPLVWFLKLFVLSLVLAVGYLGKLLLARPRPEEVAELVKANDVARQELRDERDLLGRLEREYRERMDALRQEKIELRLQMQKLELQLSQRSEDARSGDARRRGARGTGGGGDRPRREASGYDEGRGRAQ